MQIHILHGTETGMSEMLAEDVIAGLPDNEVSMQSMEDVDPTTLKSDTFYVLITSTYGTGELPVTAQPFFDALETKKPDLNGIRFAVFGLGDRTFGETFNKGSETLMNKMTELGATQVGERGIFDAAGEDFPEDIALPWIQDILAQLATQA